MAGHSHASNVKYKKNRNDKLKSEFFLKIRRKIELAYNDKEKMFLIARESNFPKEKVNSIIEKIEKSRCQGSVFTELLYKGKYQTLIYLRGNLLDHQEDLLEENVKALSLEKLYFKRPQNYFSPMYLLEADSCKNIEEVVLSSLPTLVTDKIIKIEKKEEIRRGFKIFFSEKEALTRTIEFFTNYPGVYKLESREFFRPFSPVHIVSDDFLAYFSLLENSFSRLGGNLQVFTNISNRKRDHSSVG